MLVYLWFVIYDVLTIFMIHNYFKTQTWSTIFLHDAAGGGHSSYNYNNSCHFVSSSGHSYVCLYALKSWNFDIYPLKSVQ